MSVESLEIKAAHPAPAAPPQREVIVAAAREEGAPGAESRWWWVALAGGGCLALAVMAGEWGIEGTFEV